MLKHFGLKLLAMIVGGAGLALAVFLTALIWSAITAVLGVTLVEGLGPFYWYVIVSVIVLYMIIYMGTTFFLGYRLPGISWKWGLWISAGFLMVMIPSWPLLKPFLQGSFLAPNYVLNFLAFLALLLPFAIPPLILGSLGGYFGARLRFRKENRSF